MPQWSGTSPRSPGPLCTGMASGYLAAGRWRVVCACGHISRGPTQFAAMTDHLAHERAMSDRLAPEREEIRAELTRFPVKTRLSLTGPMLVARDIAHAKIKERLDAGESMPQYLRYHCVYYAGRPRRLRAMRRAASVPPPPGVWTPTWPSSRPAVDRS